MRTLVTRTLDLWRREPHLGLLGGVSVVALLVAPVWLGARIFVPVWTGEMPFITDFSYYYEAAQRFVADPLALYPDPYGFMYPPPSVLLFLPFLALPTPAAFTVMVVLNAVLSAVAVLLALRFWEQHRDERVAAPLKATLLLVGLASAAVFQNLKYGQVNVLVLMVGLGFLGLLARERPVWAGLVLAAGFWLKLYPLVLAPLALRREQGAPCALGLGIGLVVLPVLLLPVVPLGLYEQYVFELMPYWGGVTNMHALNQSVVGVLERLHLPLEAFLLSRDTPVHAPTQVVNTVVAAVLLGGFAGAYLLRRLPRVAAGFGMLAALPVISALGWEHTYVLALPLYVIVLVEAQRRESWARWGVAFGWLVLLVPKVPEGAMVRLFEAFPRPFHDLFYARFLLVTLLFLGLMAAWAWRRETATAARAL